MPSKQNVLIHVTFSSLFSFLILLVWGAALHSASKFFQWISLHEIELRVDFKISGYQHWRQPLESLENLYRLTRSSKSVPSYFYRYSRAEISYFMVVPSFLNSTASENLDNKDIHGSTQE